MSIRKYIRIISITVVVVLTVPLSPSVFGQGGHRDSEHRLSAGLVYSPDYCYRSLMADPSDQWIVDIRNSTETPKFGYTTGLSVLFMLKPALAVESGILFSDKGWITDIQELYMRFPWDPYLRSLGPIVNTHYYFLQIPARINYYIINRNWKWFITAGISTEIMLNDDSERFGFSALAGMGVEYAMNRRLRIRCEPVFRYDLPPISRNTINIYFYSFGLNCGLFVNLF